MKRIIAIFSVILMVAFVVPTSGWGGACPTDATREHNANEDIMIGSINGNGAKFFHCDSSDCAEGTRIAVLGAYFYDGHAKSSSSYGRSHRYVCEISNGRKWAGNTEHGSWCNDADRVLPDPAWDMNTVELRGKDRPNGNVVNTGVTSNSGWGVVIPYDGCYDWYCKSPYIKNSDGKCVPDTTVAQQTCTNSHGQWDSTNSKCLCGSTDRTDGKGDGQTYDTADVSCKCSDSAHEWNETEGKCVNPNQTTINTCEASGGRWTGSTCDCTGLTNMAESGGQCTCSNPDTMMPVRHPTTGKITGCSASRQAICRSYGGVWQGTTPDDSDGVCKCDDSNSGKNLISDEKTQGSITYKICKCKNDDFVWKDGQEPNPAGCVLSPDAEWRHDKWKQLKEICEEYWNSTWYPGGWEYNVPDGRDPSKWKCTCSGDGVVQGPNKTSCMCDASNEYVLRSSTPPYECEQLDCPRLKTLCNRVSGATYRDNGVIHGRQACDCVCDDKDAVLVGGSSPKCKTINTISNVCDLIIGGAYMDRYGKCRCESTGAEPVNGRCPAASSSPVPSSSGTQNSHTDVTQKKQQIVQLTTDLKSISDGFGKSHWKTASGNFNGARLASDSVAGVVLGTVGGVVTSNIVKKNQLRGGFENMQCTVGGQMVAEFGDQFQVGIR